jgi:hypothetical protein
MKKIMYLDPVVAVVAYSDSLPYILKCVYVCEYVSTVHGDFLHN